MLDTTCERFGEEMSFFEKMEGKGFEGISFNEFRNRVTCLGEALLKIGITQRDKIAVIGKNCRKWAIAYYSIVTSNCIVVPIDKDLTSEEIERIIKRARIRGIFFENRYGKVLRNLEKKYGFLKHLVPFYPERGFKHDMEQLFKKGAEFIQNGSDKYAAVDTSRDDVASIIFTSGTPGNPKGVMLSQKNIISNIVQMRKLIWIDETMLFQIGDTICTFTKLVARRNIRRKIFHEIHERFGGKLDLFISGGAAIKPEISKFFRKLGFRVLQGYGITECSPFLAGNRDRFFDDSAAGMPSPGCEIEIYDLNENGIGEIGAKGPNVMLGYYEDPELTRKAFRNGYFMTGDSGYMDRHGFLHIAGRKKDMDRHQHREKHLS